MIHLSRDHFRSPRRVSINDHLPSRRVPASCPCPAACDFMQGIGCSSSCVKLPPCSVDCRISGIASRAINLACYTGIDCASSRPSDEYHTSPIGTYVQGLFGFVMRPYDPVGSEPSAIGRRRRIQTQRTLALCGVSAVPAPTSLL